MCLQVVLSKMYYDNNNSVAVITNKFVSESNESIGTDFSYKHEIVWKNVIFFGALHLCGIYGVYTFFLNHSFPNFLCQYVFYQTIGMFGVNIGGHRLYTHRSFKAVYPLKIFLLICFTHMGQNSLFRWVLDHRQHHKFTDTDADPHNSKRGFFFSHCGWLMAKPHPMVVKKRRTIDMSDLENDSLVMFQKKYYWVLYFIFAFLLPLSLPVYLKEDSLFNIFCFNFCFRYMMELNSTWVINSIAHLWGDTPYDKNIMPRENALAAFISNGEGWHNFHHIFPWDYRTAEKTRILNSSRWTIDMLAYLGWAYDLKSASTELVRAKILRYGNGTRKISDVKQR